MKDDISDKTLQAIKRVTLGRWGNGNLDKIADHLIDTRAQLAEITKQRDELQEWVDSQKSVDSTWNPQAIADLLGIRLGQRIRENIQPKIEELIQKLAEVTKQRDEWKELYERLNESLASNKRLFSSKLAEKVIDDQVKRIKFLEDILSKTQKELLDLKGQ